MLKQISLLRERLGFFAIRIQERYALQPDWHRRGEVRSLVRKYHVLLRPALRARSHLCGWLSCCARSAR